jgi:hypothetical protein
MTLSKGLMDLIKCQYPLIPDILSDDSIKAMMSTIKEYSTDIEHIIDKVNKEGFAYVAEPLLIYNPKSKHLSLGIRRPDDCQVLKKLCFNPKFQQSLLLECKLKGFITSAVVETYSGHHITTFIIANDHSTMKKLRSSLEKIYKGKRND